MKSKRILLFFLAVMVVWVVLALVFPNQLKELLNRPSLYRHVLFVHIIAVTLFFANGVIITGVDPGAEAIPQELMRLLKMRLWISIGGVVPLIAVFVLMVYKPEIVPVAQWFG